MELEQLAQFQEYCLDTNALVTLMCGLFDQSVGSATLTQVASSNASEYRALQLAVRHAKRITITPHVLTEALLLLKTRMAPSGFETFFLALQGWLFTLNEAFDLPKHGKNVLLANKKAGQFGIVDISVLQTPEAKHSTVIITSDSALAGLCRSSEILCIYLPELVALTEA